MYLNDPKYIYTNYTFYFCIWGRHLPERFPFYAQIYPMRYRRTVNNQTDTVQTWLHSTTFNNTNRK